MKQAPRRRLLRAGQALAVVALLLALAAVRELAVRQRHPHRAGDAAALFWGFAGAAVVTWLVAKLVTKVHQMREDLVIAELIRRERAERG